MAQLRLALINKLWIHRSDEFLFRKWRQVIQFYFSATNVLVEKQLKLSHVRVPILNMEADAVWANDARDVVCKAAVSADLYHLHLVRHLVNIKDCLRLHFEIM